MMIDANLATALGWIGCIAALSAYWGVRSWVDAQRKEREAFYRADAIKKVAEMHGTISEPVLALLREALTQTPQASQPPTFLHPAVAREYYKNEMLKRLADAKGGDAESILTVMRENEKASARRVREGLKLSGLILVFTGAALFIVLKATVPGKPAYLSGLIPTFVGAALLSYAFLVSSRE